MEMLEDYVGEETYIHVIKTRLVKCKECDE